MADSSGSSRESSVQPGSKKRGRPSFSESLSRGSACLACRSKKLRCTAERPACAACARTQQAHNVGPDEERYRCVYEDLDPGVKKSRVSRKMVQTLEDKVAELQDRVAQLPRQPQPYMTMNMPGPGTAPRQLSPNSLSSDVGGTSSSSNSPAASNHSSQTSYTPGVTGLPTPKASSDGCYLPPLPSHHSPWLPLPTTLRRIVKLYFESEHPCTSLFSFKHFFYRLSRPGTDDYPHDSLLHAIVALVIELHGEAVLEGVMPPADGGSVVNAAHWHAARARALADRGALTCDRFFDTLQSVILMSHYAYRICRFHDIWQLTGLGARVAVALRLNKMPAYSPDYKYEYCAYTAAPIRLVRIPRDVSDVTDRRMAFWWTYATERFASAITGWALFIKDEDITTLLPSASASQPDGEDDWRSMSIHSNDFFLSHPSNLIGGVQLFFKATVLLGKASSINTRSPRFGDGVKPNLSHEQMRASPDFILLERQISDFLLSTSTFTAQHPDDIYSPFISCLPYVARILAHEPLCSASLSDTSMTICLDSARRIQATLGRPGDKSTATELLPFLTFCWTVAGRSLVRQLAIKQAWNDHAGAHDLKLAIDALLGHIRSFRSPNADNAYSVLANLARNPATLMPQAAMRSPSPPPLTSAATCSMFASQSPHHPPTLPLGVSPLPLMTSLPAASNFDPVFRPRPFMAPPNFSGHSRLAFKPEVSPRDYDPMLQLATPISPAPATLRSSPPQPPVMPSPMSPRSQHEQRRYSQEASQPAHATSQSIALLHAEQDVIRMAGAVGMGSGIGALAGLTGLSGLDPSLAC